MSSKGGVYVMKSKKHYAIGHPLIRIDESDDVGTHFDSTYETFCADKEFPYELYGVFSWEGMNKNTREAAEMFLLTVLDDFRQGLTEGVDSVKRKPAKRKELFWYNMGAREVQYFCKCLKQFLGVNVWWISGDDYKADYGRFADSVGRSSSPAGFVDKSKLCMIDDKLTDFDLSGDEFGIFWRAIACTSNCYEVRDVVRGIRGVPRPKDVYWNLDFWDEPYTVLLEKALDSRGLRRAMRDMTKRAGELFDMELEIERKSAELRVREQSLDGAVLRQRKETEDEAGEEAGEEADEDSSSSEEEVDGRRWCRFC